jgi:MFS family permease
VGDIIGRKGTLFIGAIVFTIGGAIQTFTNGFTVMVVGRIVSGFGVGLLSLVALQVECASHRLTFEMSEQSFLYTRVKYLLLIMYVPTRSWIFGQRLKLCFNQRGALACMEFTGNIIGYASSVVRAMLLYLVYVAKLFTVDRLFLLIYRL